MHYPSTVEISDAEGEAIANYVNLDSMQRTTTTRFDGHPSRGLPTFASWNRLGGWLRQIEGLRRAA